jgi:hypothetical protein
MLSTANEGKWFTKKWNHERQRALIDRDEFDSDELAWLEIDSNEGQGAHDPDTWKVTTSPLDPETATTKYDARNRPRRGGAWP